MQIGIPLSELDLVTVGMVVDMYAALRESEEAPYAGYAESATQADFDRF